MLVVSVFVSVSDAFLEMEHLLVVVFLCRGFLEGQALKRGWQRICCLKFFSL